MKQLYENTWAEMDVGVRFFLLAGEKEALVIPLLIEGAEKILAGKLDGPETEVHGTVIRSVDAGVCRFLIGRRSDDHIG